MEVEKQVQECKGQQLDVEPLKEIVDYRSKPPETPTGVAPEGPATQVRCAGPGCDITFMMTKLYNGSTIRKRYPIV
jgi:hypothetical protein